MFILNQFKGATSTIHNYLGLERNGLKMAIIILETLKTIYSREEEY